MRSNNIAFIRDQGSALATNTVLRNTYLLLGLTLIFSGITAGLAMFSQTPPLNPFVTMIIYFALLALTYALRNSSWGIMAVFALTGFLGYTLGPILNIYVNTFANGTQLVMTALGGTGLIFFALSAYVLITRKDLSFMGGFLFIGCIVAMLAAIGAMIFHIPSLSLAVSAMFMLLSGGIIMFQTSQIIHGGETNYILATINIYVSLYNIFLSLLQLLGAFNDRD